MPMQISIKEPARVDGVNLYTGRRGYAIFHPAEENTGIVFAYKRQKIPATLGNAYKWLKSVSVYNSHIKINLVEHLLSAAYALGIDNLVIELSDNTCPTPAFITREYIAALKNIRAGQAEEKRFWAYKESGGTIIENSGKGPEDFEVRPSEGFVIEYHAHYPEKGVSEQKFRFEVGEDVYEKEIMEARSPAFTMGRRAKKIFLGLGRLGLHGASEENCFFIKPDGSSWPLEDSIRYNGQEFVRHKALDVLGELALTGRHFRNTEFRVRMAGHKFDLYALKKLYERGLFADA